MVISTSFLHGVSEYKDGHETLRSYAEDEDADSAQKSVMLKPSGPKVRTAREHVPGASAAGTSESDVPDFVTLETSPSTGVISPLILSSTITVESISLEKERIITFFDSPNHGFTIELIDNLIRAKQMDMTVNFTIRPEMFDIDGVNYIYTIFGLCHAVTYLTIVNCEIGDAVAEAICKITYGLHNIETLFLNNMKLSNLGIGFIADAIHLKNLKTLILTNNNLTTVAIQRIAKSELMQSIKELYIGGNQIDRKGVETIAQNGNSIEILSLSCCKGNFANVLPFIAFGKYFPKLKAIYLDGNSVGEAGCELFGRSEKSKKIEFLYLENAEINDAGAMQLVKSENLCNLGFLNLRGNNLTEEVKKAVLFRFPFAEIDNNIIETIETKAQLSALVNKMRVEKVFGHKIRLKFEKFSLKKDATTPFMDLLKLGNVIESIDVSRNPVVDSIFEMIGRVPVSPVFTALRSLNLSECQINNVRVSVIARSTVLKNLEKLYLSKNAISSDGVLSIKESENFGSLKILDLCYNPVSSRGAQYISSTDNLNQLERLLLYNCSIGDDGIRALASANNLSNLQVLTLGFNNITTDGAVVLLSPSNNISRNVVLDLRENSIDPLTDKKIYRNFYYSYLGLSHYGRRALLPCKPKTQSQQQQDKQKKTVKPAGAGSGGKIARILPVKIVRNRAVEPYEGFPWMADLKNWSQNYREIIRGFQRDLDAAVTTSDGASCKIEFKSYLNQKDIVIFVHAPHGVQLTKKYTGWQINMIEGLKEAGYFLD